uniref:Uncharacterized protein n=1 Tax=Populus alba TaxID=43335 RepID=A0A4U5QDK2_POPAL|nr:hypothetical protein D5086_0000103140 [Populus alba]
MLALLAIPKLPTRRARFRGLAFVLRSEADGPPNDCPYCSPPACPFEIRRVPRGLLLVPSRSPASPAACCLSLRDPLRPPVACCLSLQDPFASSDAGTISLGLRTCAPNCRPAAPITLSLRPWVRCGEAGFLCCVPTSVEFECEAVPLRRAPPRGRGANLVAPSVFQSSGIPPNWPTRDRSCFRMRNMMPAWGPLPLRSPHSSLLCSIRTTSPPISASCLISVGDRAGRGVAKECYLVDPASSHMLVSKIKPCMCVHRLPRPFYRRCAPGLNWPGRASDAITLKKLECSKQAYALDTLAWDNIIGF